MEEDVEAAGADLDRVSEAVLQAELGEEHKSRHVKQNVQFNLLIQPNLANVTLSVIHLSTGNFLVAFYHCLEELPA